MISFVFFRPVFLFFLNAFMLDTKKTDSAGVGSCFGCCHAHQINRKTTRKRVLLFFHLHYASLSECTVQNKNNAKTEATEIIKKWRTRLCWMETSVVFVCSRGDQYPAFHKVHSSAAVSSSITVQCSSQEETIRCLQAGGTPVSSLLLHFL